MLLCGAGKEVGSVEEDEASFGLRTIAAQDRVVWLGGWADNTTAGRVTRTGAAFVCCFFLAYFFGRGFVVAFDFDVGPESYSSVFNPSSITSSDSRRNQSPDCLLWVVYKVLTSYVVVE